MKTDSEIKDLISFLNFYKFRKEEERVAVIVEIKQLFSTEKIELTKKELSSSRFSLCSGMLFFQAQQIFGLLENNQWNYFIKKNNTLWYNLFTHETVSLGSSQVQDLVVISKSDELYYYFETNTSLLYSIDKHLIDTVLVHNYLHFFNPNELEISVGEKYLFDYETLYNQNIRALEELDVIDFALLAVSPITLLSHLYRSNKEIKIKIKGSKNKNCCLVPIIENTFGNYQLSYFYKTKKDEPKEIALQLEFTCAEAVMLFLNETILNYYLVNIDLTETDGVLGVFVNQYKTFFIDSISNKIEKEDIWSKREALNLIFCLPEQYTFNPVLGKSVYLTLFKWLVTEGDFNNFGQFKSEDGFIKLLQNIYDSLQTNQDFQSFLNLFLVERKGTPILKYLLKAIDGDNFIVFCNIMEKIWRKTAYINPDLAIYNTIKEEDQGPLLLPYESQKWLGIYIANATVEYDKRIEIKHLGTGQYKEVQRPNPKGGGYYTHKEEITVDYVYHPFYPVYIKNTQENETSLELNSIIPAFMLFANKEKAFWSNVVTISEYAFDIVTTFSGIGNIAKFRHLTKVAARANKLRFVTQTGKTILAAQKAIAATAAVVEISAGTVSALFKLTDARYTKWGKSILDFLFWLELLSLSGELTVAIHNGLRKSARKLVEQTEDAAKLEKQLDDLVEEGKVTRKDADEVVEELRNVAEAGNEGDITKTFFHNARIALKKEKALGKVFGQSKDYTCASSSLKMVLDDIGIVRSEEFLADLIETIHIGDNRGATILDIPKGFLKDSRLSTLEVIARGGGKDVVSVDALEKLLKKSGRKAIVSIHYKDFGAHAVVVDKIENGRVFLRDPLPIYIGASYSVTLKDFKKVYNEKFVTIK